MAAEMAKLWEENEPLIVETTNRLHITRPPEVTGQTAWRIDDTCGGLIDGYYKACSIWLYPGEGGGWAGVGQLAYPGEPPLVNAEGETPEEVIDALVTAAQNTWGALNA